MVNFGFTFNDDEDEERMAFGNVRSMGIWGTALAASVALHVIVLGALLCTRGCGPGKPDGGALPPNPPAVEQADTEAVPPRADETETRREAKAPEHPKKAETKRPAKMPERTAPKDNDNPTTGVPTGWKTYKVRPGDSLSRLARQFGCTVHELAKMNGLSPTASLRLGQTLKVKDVSAD